MFQDRVQKIIFQIISVGMLLTVLIGFFSIDPEAHWTLMTVVFILSVLFFLASIKIEFAFLLSLFLLPIFFLLDNFQELNNVYGLSLSDSFSSFSIDVRAIGFLITTIFSIIILYKRRANFKLAPLSKILPVSIFLLCLGIFWTNYPETGIVQVSFFVFLGTIYFVTFLLIEKFSDLIWMIILMAGFSLPSILFAYYQLFSGLFFYHSDLEIGRVTGPFSRANQFGNYLFLIMALLLVLSLSVANKKGKNIFSRFSILYIIMAFPIFILTYSRSSWVALIIFLGIFSVQKRRFFISTILVLAIITSILMSFENTQKRILGIFERSMFDSVYARREVWSLSYDKFKTSPLIGYGAGSFSEVIRDAKESGGGTDNPHNDVVFFAVEGGIVSVTSYLMFIFGFYYYLLRNYLYFKRRPSREVEFLDNLKYSINLKIMSFGVLSLFFTISVISMVESYYEGNLLNIFVWTILAGWFAFSNEFMGNSKKILKK